ncbi:MAG: sulfite exporter TauE/SafE family protein [Proteobacteria bacterium]|nr:sulfite exporter TauE/SafE family protein [Pseudomonadota bacterium]MCH9757840.1 sulfite exporter TauE/SafE family protein [Pseudomonadota bacterium]
MRLEQLLAAANLNGTQLLLLLLIVFIGAIIRGYAGFGLSALVVASTSLFLPTREAVPFVLVIEVIASLQMVKQIWRHINWRLISCILISVAIFSPLGQYALRVTDIELMRLITAILLLMAVGLVAAGRFFTIPNAPSGWLLTGCVSGFMNGLLAMGGIWTMVFLVNSGVQVAVLRASLVALFFITDIYAISVATFYDLIDRSILVRVVCALPLVFLGIHLGAARFNPTQQEKYKTIVLLLLTLLALLLIIRTLANYY